MYAPAKYGSHLDDPYINKIHIHPPSPEPLSRHSTPDYDYSPYSSHSNLSFDDSHVLEGFAEASNFQGPSQSLLMVDDLTTNPYNHYRSSSPSASHSSRSPSPSDSLATAPSRSPSASPQPDYVPLSYRARSRSDTALDLPDWDIAGGQQLWRNDARRLTVGVDDSERPLKVDFGPDGQPPKAAVSKRKVTTDQPIDTSGKRRKKGTSFGCPLCGVAFTTSFSLANHVRAHDGGKPFRCQWPGCGKTFANYSNCKYHEQVHVALHCGACDRSFLNKDNLNRHLLNFHAELPGTNTIRRHSNPAMRTISSSPAPTSQFMNGLNIFPSSTKISSHQAQIQPVGGQRIRGRDRGKEKERSHQHGTHRSQSTGTTFVGGNQTALSTVPSHQSIRCITADNAFSHASAMEPSLLEALGRLQYDGLYQIQVGFNEVMIEEGLLVQEIYISLDADMHMPGQEVCSVFEAALTPFPGIVYTPSETYHIPIDSSLSATSSNTESTWARVDGQSGNDADSRGGEDLNDGNGEGGGRKDGDESGSKGDGSREDNDNSDERRGGKGQPTGQAGRRVLNIPRFGSKLTISGEDDSHQVEVAGGLDITVDENFRGESCPEGSEWSGPWFNVGMTNLRVDSNFKSQPTYTFSLVQVRIKAKGKSQCVVGLSETQTPTSSTFAADTAIVRRERVHQFGFAAVLGTSPAARLSGWWGSISGREDVERRWAINTHSTMSSADGEESEDVSWSYTHNDAHPTFGAERPQKWTFDRGFLPSSSFGFSRREAAPIVEADLMVFWSTDSKASHADRRGFVPFRHGTAAKDNKPPVFANFIHQVAIVVDVNDIKDTKSSVIVGDIADRATFSAAAPANEGAVHFGPPIRRAAETHSNTDLGRGSRTNCHVLVRRAIEGRASLTDAERKGLSLLELSSPTPVWGSATILGLPTPSVTPKTFSLGPAHLGENNPTSIANADPLSQVE